MDPMTDDDQGTPRCDLPPEGWHCGLEKGHDGPCPAYEDDVPEPRRPRSGNAVLIVLVSLTLVIGLGLTALQLISQRKDASDRRSDLITACRGDFSVKYVTGPTAKVQNLESRLVQIQAAGLEGTTADDGRSGVSTEGTSPYDGMTLEQLRPLSVASRAELAVEQVNKETSLDIFRDLSKLAKNDPDQFLIECKEQLS